MFGLLGSWTGRLVAVALVAAVALGGIFYMRATAAPAKAEFRTTAVTRGSVTQTVAVSGSVNPAAQIKVNFKTGGKLSQVMVAVGQQVTAGQTLAQLDTTDLDNAVAQARNNVTSAQASYQRATAGADPNDLASAQQNLTRVKTTYTSQRAVFQNASSGARTDLVVFQSALDALQAAIQKAQGAIQPVAQPTPTPVPTITPEPDQPIPTPQTTPNTSLADARTSWNQLNQANAYVTNAQSYGADQLRNALGEYITALASLNFAIAAWDTAIGSDADASTSAGVFQAAQAQYSTSASRLGASMDSLTALLNSSQGSLTSAQNALNTGGSRFDPLLDPGRAAISNALASATGGQQAASSAKAKLSQAGNALATVGDAIGGSYQSAVNALNKTSATPKPYDITSAFASVQGAQINLDTAMNNLANATLAAPAAGVVAAVNSQVGEFVGTGGTTGFIVLANTTGLALHGTIGEADVAKLKLGQVANVTVDALGTASRMTGKVTSIDPVATIQQGVPVYGVDVTVDLANAGLRPGMTGTANVIIASKTGVLTVPNLAIRSAAGRRFVQVLKNGDAVDTDVQFGIANDSVTEVVSGLQEGDLLVLPQPRASGSGGAIRPGGPGGVVINR